jgi:hypothetical protein
MRAKHGLIQTLARSSCGDKKRKTLTLEQPGFF